MKKIPIGTKSFSRLVEGNYYFVDKTLMIKEFLDRGTDVTLITRPRRFGKTINMSMMAEFFDITKDSKKIFNGTKIMETPYAAEINQYPTIFISFADAKRDKETVVSTIRTQIQNQWDKYDFVFENLKGFKKTNYERLYEVLADNNKNNLKGIDDAISFLMERMEDYYGKEVMVFIDEYDTPFVEAHTGGFYDEVRGGLAGLLHNSLKTSTSLKYAMLTGIQRVAKENIFSDLNNLDVYTVIDNDYSEYFGFSIEETKELLEYYDLELDEEVKEMYDGYKMGDKEIYNPWSILNYARRKVLVPYWVNTSANTMLKQAIEKADYDFKKQYEKLIKNNYLETRVVLQTSFYEVANTPNLWGMFVSAGYLTVTKSIDALNDQYRVEIPNKEIRKEFINLTEYYLALQTGQLNDVVYNLLQEDRDEFFDSYQNILMLPSYHDLNDENSYHMMMLGMCICLSNNYKVISNREEGKGRCDIIIQAKDEKKTSFVIEFKYFKEDKKDFEKALDKLSNEAIQQIKDRKYDYNLKGKVIYIGLAHHGKDVMMKWIER
ncbi:AAA family ATPase [Faecalibacillus faecis]|uniref:ATP-binding protein n=2 Tax=Faecalibacillus faecis TaxID=1982628 RepID=A0AAW4VNI5_9FIRM|nr:AAA family ATPase [Faecalibacillus faecis]MCB8568617.1 ATP-binding protein [Faecalibacillus faecis]MCB8610696.1 ATP-binding protein [Faecalibacillus faecis]MCQ5200571.1 ATP-binding protein [Faecalibacillus faecis]